jgi:hypothetical protein
MLLLQAASALAQHTGGVRPARESGCARGRFLRQPPGQLQRGAHDLGLHPPHAAERGQFTTLARARPVSEP